MADALDCDAHTYPPAQKSNEAQDDKTSESSNYLEKPILDAGLHKLARDKHAV